MKMGTHASIGKLNADGTVTAIYLHYDGYRSHCGKILEENYNTDEKVDELLALGSLSSIGSEIGEKHERDYKNPKFENWCDAHHRDWGRDIKIMNYSSRSSWIHNGDEEYMYIWENGEWTWFHNPID
jgi:hypothetical protein